MCQPKQDKGKASQGNPDGSPGLGSASSNRSTLRGRVSYQLIKVKACPLYLLKEVLKTTLAHFLPPQGLEIAPEEKLPIHW